MKRNFVGERFGRLVVVEDLGRTEDYGRRLLVSCDCGGEKTVRSKNLQKGLTTSCGCAKREAMAKIGKSTRTHGHGHGTPEYRTWRGARARCHDTTHKQYPQYGGRGIAMAPEWRDDFAAFLAHVGLRPTPKHSLDRIDNDRGYEPGNVRWTTQEVQANNTRSNHWVEVGGVAMTLAQAIRLKDQKSNVVRSRLANGWSLERALNEAARPRRHRTRR